MVRVAVAKLGDAVIDGEMGGSPLPPALVIKGIEVLHGFDRLIVADEHHADRLDLAERSLQARSRVGNYRPGSVQGLQTSAPTGVMIYIPDNGRDTPLDDDQRLEDLLQD